MSVDSVNGQTGAVSVTPANIGAVAKSGDTMTGGLTVGSSATGGSPLTVGSNNTGHEFGLAQSVSFHDFHSSGTGQDFDARILSSGPSSPTAAGQGALTYTAGAHSFQGPVSLNQSLTLNHQPVWLAGQGDGNHVIGNGLDNFFGSSDGETLSFWRFFNVKSNYGAPNRSCILVDGQTGNVGIDTLAPTCTLDVNGTVRAVGLNFRPQISYDDIEAGYRQSIRHMNFNFYNNTLRRIDTVDGGSGWGVVVGAQNSPGAFWMMAQYHNVLYWHWRKTGSQVVAQMIKDQWTFIQSVYAQSAMPSTSSYFGVTSNCVYGQNWGLGSNGSLDGTVGASDDGAWKCLYLMQAHEVTGDPNALNFLTQAIVNILNFYKDPNHAQVQDSGLNYSPYGILYARPENSGAAQGIASSYEVGLAIASLYVWQQTAYGNYRDYAQACFNWLQTYYKHQSGNYIVDCLLNPTPTAVSASVTNAAAKNSSEGSYQYNKLCCSALGLAGTMGLAVLAARLYREFGNGNYLTECSSVANSIIKTCDGGNWNDNTDNLQSATAANWGFQAQNTTYAGTFGVYRDPYTEGFYAPAFATEVLSLTGVDSSGPCRAMFAATARAITTQYNNIGQAGYTADWCGPQSPNVSAGILQGYNGYQSHYNANPTASYNQAGYQQIMTASNAVAMVQAAAILEGWAQRT